VGSDPTSKVDNDISRVGVFRKKIQNFNTFSNHIQLSITIADNMRKVPFINKTNNEILQDFRIGI
jgi:hypothetical protein